MNDNCQNVLWFYKKSPNLKKFWILFGILFGLLFLVITFYSYQKTKTYYGQVQNGAIYFYIEEENQVFLKNPYRLDDNLVDCRMIKNAEKYFVMKQKVYDEIVLQCASLWKEETIIPLTITFPKTTLIKEIEKKIKKGLMM